MEYLKEIIIAAVSSVGLSLITFLFAKLNAYIKSKIKNEEVRQLFYGAVEVCDNITRQTYQTVVEEIKGTDKWTLEEQKRVLSVAVLHAKNQLSEAAKQLITEQHGNLENWIKTQIESAIYNLKK